MFEALRNFFAIFLLLTFWVVQLSLPTPCAQNPTLGAKQDEGPNTAGLLVNIFTLAWTKISKPRGVGQVQISIVSDNSYKSFFFFFGNSYNLLANPLPEPFLLLELQALQSSYFCCKTYYRCL